MKDVCCFCLEAMGHDPVPELNRHAACWMQHHLWNSGSQPFLSYVQSILGWKKDGIRSILHIIETIQLINLHLYCIEYL